MTTPTIHLEGITRAGSKHGLLLEPKPDGLQFTITGNNGKRHAAVKLDESQLADLFHYLADYGDDTTTDGR